MTIQVAEARAREASRGGRKKATAKMSSPRSPREESVEEMETEVTPEPNGELLWKCGVCVILCLCLV